MECIAKSYNPAVICNVSERFIIWENCIRENFIPGFLLHDSIKNITKTVYCKLFYSYSLPEFENI